MTNHISGTTEGGPPQCFCPQRLTRTSLRSTMQKTGQSDPSAPGVLGGQYPFPKATADPFSSSLTLPYHRFSDLRSSGNMLGTSTISAMMSHQQQSNSATFTTSKNGPAKPPIAQGCVDCVQECNEPSCPSGEITSQCTDQCIVIACTDPDHGGMSCHGPGEDTHCDLICDGAKNCVDCSGFDEFVSRYPLVAATFQTML